MGSCFQSDVEEQACATGPCARWFDLRSTPAGLLGDQHRAHHLLQSGDGEIGDIAAIGSEENANAKMFPFQERKCVFRRLFSNVSLLKRSCVFIMFWAFLAVKHDA